MTGCGVGSGLQQAFVTPHCPQQNGMVERAIRTLKEPCVHRHRLESQTRTLGVIADWISFHNPKRLHRALRMMTTDAAQAAGHPHDPSRKRWVMTSRQVMKASMSDFLAEKSLSGQE